MQKYLLEKYTYVIFYMAFSDMEIEYGTMTFGNKSGERSKSFQ
jgi:hypothetical protein